MNEKKGTKKTGRIPVRITDTTLRDSHQSLWATRMRTDDIMRIIDAIDAVGYYSLEVWGGATFDVCLRFLRENPWERLRMIKSKTPRTPLQMLLRGQNLVGYRNYPDDLVDRFVATACENGIDIFRVFDALNDSRNLEAAIKAVKKYGGHAQGTLSYTTSPVHTVEKYIGYAKEQVELGIDSLCIKDMAGIITPTAATELVGGLTREFDIPIQMHCHATSGMGTASYVAGVKAGAGAVDCAISTMAGFSSQPPVETLYAIFKDAGYDIDLDVEALRKISKYFFNLSKNRTSVREHRPVIDSEILVHKIPGGMISNFKSQLEQQGALDKLAEAQEEVSRVREDLGYPPLVTPTSQIVGTQAVLNVLSGERYKVVPNEVKNYIRGFYGKSPAPIKKELITKILGEEKPITHRPADKLEPMLPNAASDVDPQLIEDEEDIISYCLFPEPSLEYFKWRSLPPEDRPEIPADLELAKIKEENHPPAPFKERRAKNHKDEAILLPEDYSGMKGLLEKAASMQLNELSVRKGDFTLTLKSEEGSAELTKAKTPAKQPEPAEEAVPVPESGEKTGPAPAEQEKAAYSETIDAIMTGTFYESSQAGEPPFVTAGSEVNEGDTVCILEAMKLFNEIAAPKKCRIVQVLAKTGEIVEKGTPIFGIESIT